MPWFGLDGKAVNLLERIAFERNGCALPTCVPILSDLRLCSSLQHVAKTTILTDAWKGSSMITARPS